MCQIAVRNAGVPGAIASRSRKPTAAAASAPTTPMPISHSAPWARNPGWAANREATSNTRLASQDPMGTVTSSGCSGCPYGPASRGLTGCLACRMPVLTEPLLT